MQNRNDILLQAEDDFFSALKRLMLARSESGSAEVDLDRIGRLAKRHGLKFRLAQSIWSVIEKASGVEGVRFEPSILRFTPYADKDKKSASKGGSEDVLDLSNNENPLGPSERVIASLRDEALKLGKYPPLSDYRLRVGIAESLGNGQIGPDQVVLGRGVNHLLSEIAFAFLREGDEAVVCARSFPVYYETAERVGCKIHRIPVLADHAYDIPALCNALSRKPQICYLGSPNNPTGVIIDPPKFESLVDHLGDETLLVMDECYRDYADVELPDTFGAIARRKNIISLRSFSKAYGLAALRIGYAVAAPELAGYLERRREPYHTGQLVIAACLAAMADELHVKESISLAKRERSYLQEGLLALGLEVWPSQANFLLFRPRPEEGRDEEGVARSVLQKLSDDHRIKIRDLSRSFGLPGYLRASVGLHQDNARFLEALVMVLKEVMPN